MKRTFWGIQLFRRAISNFKVLKMLWNDFRGGRYRVFPYKALSAIVLFVVYILNPFDLISDLVPVWGQLDDAAMLMFCLYLLEKETEKYILWSSKNANTA
ncbi:protein containing DUF1232 [Candidatus Magnetomorum sp. HK-1]|nr:protein containing DUF1232 [Candidatus Magnetomorum sp. HK-1]